MRRLGAIGRVVAVSSLYETAPVGGPDQADYLNAVVLLETAAPPRAVLQHCLVVERERGRERGERWAPRTLDLDVLVVGDDRIDEPGLVIPHPRIAERRFVVDPLAEVWPGVLPDGRRPEELLGPVADQRVRAVADPDWAEAGRRRGVLVVAASALGVVAVLAVWWLRQRGGAGSAAP